MRVAWISEFPVEWCPELAGRIPAVPVRHPRSWMRVLFDELKGAPGLELHIVSLRKEYPRPCSFELDGVHFHLVRTPPLLRLGTAYWSDTVLLRRLLRRVRPDLVHAWGTEEGAGIVASRLGFRFLLTLQGVLSWISEFATLNWHQRRNTALELRALKASQRITVESDALAKYVGHKFPHLLIEQIEHAPAWLFHRVPRKPAGGTPSILVVGTPGHHKGTDVMVTTLADVAKTHSVEVRFIGSGTIPYPVWLERFGSEMLRQRSVVKSSVTREELADEYARCTLLLHGSRADNSPNVVKEALVAGVPVLASAVGGIPENVKDGLSGLLFPPDNPEQTARCLRAALAHSVLGAGKVDRSALEEARRRLSPALMASRFLQTYQQTGLC